MLSFCLKLGVKLKRRAKFELKLNFVPNSKLKHERLKMSLKLKLSQSPGLTLPSVTCCINVFELSFRCIYLKVSSTFFLKRSTNFNLSLFAFATQLLPSRCGPLHRPVSIEIGAVYRSFRTCRFWFHTSQIILTSRNPPDANLSDLRNWDKNSRALCSWLDMFRSPVARNNGERGNKVFQLGNRYYLSSLR